MNDEEGCRDNDDEQFLTPKQAATLLQVNSKTVARWEQAGKIGSIRTIGGHRRYHSSEIYAILHDV